MAKFKVGDRVRNHMVPEAGIGTVEEVRGNGRYLVHYMNTWFGHCSDTDSSLEPALTIETGKFYRTRDGRKVGPMERWNHAVEHPWQQQGGSAVFTMGGDIWRDDGSSEYGMPQLIAEWVDEPAGNDNAPLPKPAIVALIEDGQPKPSDAPRVHKSQESATDEAERLAVKYPGQKFGVFVLADSRIADVVIRRAA